MGHVSITLLFAHVLQTHRPDSNYPTDT